MSGEDRFRRFVFDRNKSTKDLLLPPLVIPSPLSWEVTELVDGCLLAFMPSLLFAVDEIRNGDVSGVRGICFFTEVLATNALAEE